MDIPNSDIVIPVAIIVGCLLIVWLTVRLTRQRAKGWELHDLGDAGDIDEALIDIDALDAWHRDHGSVVTSWIDCHEESLDALGRSGLQLDLTSESPAVDSDIDTQMRSAITAHPTPAMRAQLSAMTVAAEATVVAVRRSDYATAERQHLTYIEYRDQWLYRLRQFSPNDRNLGAVVEEANRHGADFLRAVPSGPPATEPEPAPAQVDDGQGSLLDDPGGGSGTDADSEGALVTELNPEQADDPWQISRPRRSRRKRRRAG